MKKVWITAALGTAMLAAGCQEKQLVQTAGHSSAQADQTIQLTPIAASDATPTPSPSQAPVPTPTPVPKTYQMNKNYDIVPIDSNGNKKVILLTFDDAPKDKDMLNSIIDTLDKHHAKAIFFVNGYRVKQNPDLLKLIDERDQLIGNHSWDHIDLKKESEEKIDQQIDDVQSIVKDITGKSPVFFRPPYGSWKDHVMEKANQDNLLLMTWSNGSLDWDQPSKLDDQAKGQAIIDSVMKQLHYGSNILMHELPWTAKVLDELLTKLEEKGYSFVDPRSIDTTKQP